LECAFVLIGLLKYRRFDLNFYYGVIYQVFLRWVANLGPYTWLNLVMLSRIRIRITRILNVTSVMIKLLIVSLHLLVSNGKVRSV
jgi:hypothetical protein